MYGGGTNIVCDVSSGSVCVCCDILRRKLPCQVHLFSAVRRRTLCTAGPYRAQQLLHDYGAWLLFETIPDEHRQLERLQRVSLDDFHQERQRMLQHLESRTADRRFRRQPQAYLATLETEAVAIAQLE
ncbi:MAG: hypothetical protein V3S14_08010 [Anaerolineae bacterium]